MGLAPLIGSQMAAVFVCEWVFSYIGLICYVCIVCHVLKDVFEVLFVGACGCVFTFYVSIINDNLP